jgi:3-hydroxyisobutyrate dehydrogenase-like beta-hydroxyacid dehydrogenase
MKDSPVAVIGLGLMGEVYARRLLDARLPVIGYDIDPSKRDRLAAIGGRSVDGIAELAKPARCIIIAVFNTDEVEDVIEQHLLPALGEGSKKIVLCMSTCDPDKVSALAERVIPRGIRYLDAPVSGTSEQVRRGEGVALVGGDDGLGRPFE